MLGHSTALSGSSMGGKIAPVALVRGPANTGRMRKSGAWIFLAN
jgi:hypothetical protein